MLKRRAIRFTKHFVLGTILSYFIGVTFSLIRESEWPAFVIRHFENQSEPAYQHTVVQTTHGPCTLIWDYSVYFDIMWVGQGGFEEVETPRGWVVDYKSETPKPVPASSLRLKHGHKAYGSLPSWMLIKHPMKHMETQVSIALGWPLRTVFCRGSVDIGSSIFALFKTDGIPVPWSDLSQKEYRQKSVFTGPAEHMPWGIAWRPIWTNLFISGLFYGAILFGLATLYRWLHAKRRIRRGLCATCEYDLSQTNDQLCPECGAARH